MELQISRVVYIWRPIAFEDACMMISMKNNLPTYPGLEFVNVNM